MQLCINRSAVLSLCNQFEIMKDENWERERDGERMKFEIVTRFEKFEDSKIYRWECSVVENRMQWRRQESSVMLCLHFVGWFVDSFIRLLFAERFFPTRNQSQRKNNIIIIIIVVYCIYRIVSLCGVTFVVILLIFPLVLLVRIRIIIIIHRSYLRCRRVSKWVKSVSSTIYFYILVCVRVWMC